MSYGNSENVILVLGARGNLGSQIVHELGVNKCGKVIAWTRDECDVMNRVMVEKNIYRIRPSVVINTVAYNDVDACENDLGEQRKAIELNVQLVECLARVCQEINARLIQFSTNYVFSGEMNSYNEYDTVSPINFYGMTKELGEKAILSKLDEGLEGSIIRVSNLFGPRGTSKVSKPSFFDAITNAAEVRNTLNVIDDEKCCFTYTKDVACWVIERLKDKEFSGIYHCINSEPVTWYEAAKIYFELCNRKIEINPVESRSFNRVAKRPKTAILKNTRTETLRSYKLALAEYVQEISGKII